MSESNAPLAPGVYYHIYSRGNNREKIFIEARNYAYFLALYSKYIEPIADTYAYCLLGNHFHFLVRIKTGEEFLAAQTSVDNTNQTMSKFDPSKRFSNLCNAYAKAINKGYNRTGSLFEENFGRIPVTTDAYLDMLIFYIHYNPQKHGLTKDFREWHWSSYHTLIRTGSTRLRREEVLDIFGGLQGFEEFHLGMMDEKKISSLLDE